MQEKTVSLDLGSGGASGYAHIGVIEEILNFMSVQKLIK
jgi:predicted acylesterase/phospholipase RssA